jgi:HEPN domain-containing protein
MTKEESLNVEARAYYSMALRYLGAANKLYSLSLATGKAAHFWAWFNPIQFLYFHAIELALKAYLWSFNLNVERTHNITNLYRQCRDRGLKIRADDLTGIANVVSLLDSNNEGKDFRYFSSKSRGNLPELSWTRDEANQLMGVVGRRLRRMGFTTKPGQPIVRLVGILGKPRKRTRRSE